MPAAILPEAVVEAGFDDIAHHWRCSRLTVRVIRPVDFDTGASLATRLRGALGHALLDRRDEPEVEMARRVLFEPQAWRARAELPKPFVISADEEGQHIRIVLTLFGMADRWRTPVFDGLIRALGRGIAVSLEGNGARRVLRVADAGWARTETLGVPVAGFSVRLRFRTPFRLGPRHGLGVRYGDLVVSLAERAAGLALWQGLKVEPHLGDWRALANRLIFRDDDLIPFAWERQSGAQGGRHVAMQGLTGVLDIVRPPEILMPLLALGETMHVGGGAALGLGRYDLL